MSYNGSGTFQINTSGQPVVAGTVISSTAFNALTADLATGLSTAITKDGQTATTVRIPFAAGISSTLVTDSTSTSTGSIITAGGVGVAKALFVGTTANVAGAVTLQGALGVTGVTTVQAGTAAAPAITTTGDTNTGIFFPAADTIAFSEGGAEAARIDSSGNFGIGTTTPAAKLDVSGAMNTAGLITNNFPSSSGNIVALNNTAGERFVVAGDGGGIYLGTTAASAHTSLRVIAADSVVTTFSTTGIAVTGLTDISAATSGQIKFPATQNASANANTLDDYEEGTWTPAEANVTVSTSVGHYTKIGNMVTAMAYMVWPSTADANNVVINGLPFTIANTEDNRSCFITQCNAALLLSGTGSVMGIPNSTQSQLFKADNNRATNVNMTTAALRATWVYYV